MKIMKEAYDSMPMHLLRDMAIGSIMVGIICLLVAGVEACLAGLFFGAVAGLCAALSAPQPDEDAFLPGAGLPPLGHR